MKTPNSKIARRGTAGWRLPIGRRFGWCVAVWVGVAASAAAQSYSIPWHTVDGGGGRSTNAQFSVTGTIGQPDAGAMSGGNFTLQGGFWGVIAAVQTPDAPPLWVTRTTTNTVVVGWALSEVNWHLQTSTNLSVSASWTDIPPPYTTNAPNCYFTQPLPAGNRFYRLHKQ